MLFQQLIQSQLLHLISMLVCIGVVVGLFAKRFSCNEIEVQDDNVRRLNTYYISGILTFIVIELVTAICMGNTRHADILSFVSFAATLSSLILSVIAIIFTIVSSKRGEFQYQKLDRVSDDVKDSLSSFTQKTESLDASIDRFRTVADELSVQLHEINDKVNRLETPINEIHQQMLPLGSQVNANKTKNGFSDDSFNARVSSFILHGSFSGNLALYACVLSQEKERPFLMSQIRDNDEDEAYKFGYIVASSAMGVINAQLSGQRRVQVSFVFLGLKDMLERALNTFIEKTEDPNSKQLNIEHWDYIKKVFE